MLSAKNRIYGLAVGGVITDSMGALSSYMPDIQIRSPDALNRFGIKPGYWTEPTGLWYGRLEQQYNDQVSHMKPKNCTGVFSTVEASQYPLLSLLVQTSVYALRYHNNYQQQLKAVDDLCDGNPIHLHCGKFWLSLIDGVLHQASKKSVLKTEMYSHLDPIPEIYIVLGEGNADYLDQELQLVAEVIRVFKTTDNFLDGLYQIIDNSDSPCWTGSLYGQLAGAYYGITDLPEGWMDMVRCDGIMELLTKVEFGVKCR